MEGGGHSFWKTLPGILTGIGGVLTAIAGLLGILYQIGYFEGQAEQDAATTTDTSQEERGTSTPPKPQEDEPGFRVIEATLRAEPSSITGPCPVTVNFTGRISVVGGEGTVSYTFIRSDGASAPVETLHFAEPGSRDIETSWKLGAPGARVSGWQAIKIFDPDEQESARANFSINCLRTIDPGKLKLPGS